MGTVAPLDFTDSGNYDFWGLLDANVSNNKYIDYFGDNQQGGYGKTFIIGGELPEGQSRKAWVMGNRTDVPILLIDKNGTTSSTLNDYLETSGTLPSAVLLQDKRSYSYVDSTEITLAPDLRHKVPFGQMDYLGGGHGQNVIGLGAVKYQENIAQYGNPEGVSYQDLYDYYYEDDPELPLGAVRVIQGRNWNDGWDEFQDYEKLEISTPDGWRTTANFEI